MAIDAGLLRRLTEGAGLSLGDRVANAITRLTWRERPASHSGVPTALSSWKLSPGCIGAATTNPDALTRLAPYTADQTPIDGRATAYVCRHFACDAPVTSADELQSLEAIGNKTR